MVAPPTYDGYASVPRPPELPWSVLSHLTHLNNLSKMPLPMILEATRQEEAARAKDKLASGAAAPAASSPAGKKFFTISTKGRTLAELTEQQQQSSVRHGGSPTDRSPALSTPIQQFSNGGSSYGGEQTDRPAAQARLPAYLSNPYVEMLSHPEKFLQSDDVESDAYNSGRRRSHAAGGATSGRRRSSVARFMGAVSDRGVSPRTLEPFSSTTFCREGLNVEKLRQIERNCAERERRAREEAEKEQTIMKQGTEGFGSVANVVGLLSDRDHSVPLGAGGIASSVLASLPTLTISAHPFDTVSGSAPKVMPPTPRTLQSLLDRRHAQNHFKHQELQDETVDWSDPSHGLSNGSRFVNSVKVVQAQASAAASPSSACLSASPVALSSRAPTGVSLLPKPLVDPRFLGGFGNVHGSHHSKSLAGGCGKPSPRRVAAPSPHEEKSILEDPKTHTRSYRANPFHELGQTIHFTVH